MGFSTLLDNGKLLANIEAKLKNVDKGEFAALDALTTEGVKVYKAVADLFRNSPYKKTRNAATMNALVYAHIADRFASVKRVAGNKKYTALDFMKAHPIEFGGEAEQGALGQPVTNPAITLDTDVKVVEANRIFEGRNWWDIRERFFKEYPDLAKRIATDKDGTQRHTPTVNELSGAKVVLSNKSIEHALSDATSTTKVDAETLTLRRDIQHYELIPILPELIRKGVLIEEHPDKHKKADRVYRLFGAVSFDGKEPVVVKLTLKKERTIYMLDGGGNTHIRVYDVQRTKKELAKRPKASDKSVSHPGSLTSSYLSIAEILKDVKDNDGVPYIDDNGNLNVNFVENTNTFNQSAWHGTPHSFNSFDLGSIGSGEGAQVHGWGLYFAKDKKVAETYRERLSRKCLAFFQLNSRTRYVDRKRFMMFLYNFVQCIAIFVQMW